MTAPITVASCINHDCPEYGIDKDMSTVPPDWNEPIWCGGCGSEITYEDTEGLVRREPEPIHPFKPEEATT